MRLLFTLCCLSPIFAWGQLETANWHFGSQLGFDFSSGDPIEITDSEIFTLEGSASISDCEGNLLFYTNGGGTLPGGFDSGKIWNANNEVMYDMEGLEGGGWSAAQSSIIFKKPGDNNIYYLFTMEQAEYNVDGEIPSQPLGRGLSYFEIDMDLNGGLGEVTVADERVYVPAYEALTACLHDNQEDYWVIIPANDVSQFGVFLVTEEGVVDTSFYQPANPMLFGGGYYKVSPDRNKLYAAGYLYDFDASTGAISNAQFLNNGTYSASFSMNSEYLYAQGQGLGEIVRYEVNVPNPGSTESFVGVIGTPFPLPGGFQLALDSSIYFISVESFMTTNVYRITGIDGPSPEVEGPIFVYDGVYSAYFGLPNFTDHLFIEGGGLQTPPLINTEITTICPGDTILLDAQNTGANFNWSTGDTAQTIAITEPGTYGVDIFNDCTQLFSEVTIEATPAVDAEIQASQPVLCLGQNIDLSLITNVNGAADILWNTGVSNELSITIEEPGLYSATVQNACGEETVAEINIELIDEPPVLTLNGPGEAFCEGDTITLLATAENATNVGWLDAGGAVELPVLEAGSYVAIAENSCFQVEEALEVETQPCTDCLEVPNIFTPNRDNLNDAFIPLINCTVLSYRLEIYNRWGEQVFSSERSDQAWDGTFNGEPLPTDVYAYLLSIEFDSEVEPSAQLQGELSLIR